jgi:integrase
VQPISLAHRLGAARGFARYLQTIDPWTEVPPAGIWPATVPRPAPYLYSDADITALLAAARALQPPLRAVTLVTVLGLLVVTGMRVGEALSIGRGDVDLRRGVITIREAKLDRERLLPLHPSTTDALRGYAEHRDLAHPEPSATTFFLGTARGSLSYHSVRATFAELTAAIGLRTSTVQPRIHDLRHSFAVRTLIGFHRSGVDIAAGIAVLGAYLGHVNPAGTYWYLSASPELMELAAQRLENRSEAPQ